LPQPEWFFGTYEHSLDDKGRLILPAKIRGRLSGAPVYLTQHLDNCVALWTMEQFEKEVAVRQAAAELGPVERNAVRDWSAAVHEVELDRQGRMAIPQQLRTYASLEQEVLVTGAINRVELWSPDLWQRKGEIASAASPSSTVPQSSHPAAPSP
jgi:MraZ protein